MLSIAREINTSLAHGSLVTLVTIRQSRKLRTLLSTHYVQTCAGPHQASYLALTILGGRYCYAPPQLWEGSRLI